ncbi:MAG: heavy metal translocating P-type ATPase metal-binding domain-containing protein, partial [Cellvibrionaceae bacterium]|nr:heavy metal translocating P-type ATPase metal-binding domain-containing protein [Cellvibrionaceae bacterium]
MSDPQPCYHCQLPVPKDANFSVEIDGVEQPMCCVGCQAVASAIVNGGLSQFYQYRSESADTPESLGSDSWQVYDLDEVQQDFVNPLEGSRKQAQLLIGGITCAACVWLIEQHLSRLPQVLKVRVNAGTHRCWVEYDERVGKLSEIFASLDSVGFRPQAATDENQNRLLDSENRLALRRLGVAGIGMMQV